MGVELTVTKYENGDDWFTFLIDRQLTYDFDEEELREICYMYLDKILIRYMDKDYWDETEQEHGKQLVESVKVALRVLSDHGTLLKPNKGVRYEQYKND
jgi:hypothetical protein